MKHLLITCLLVSGTWLAASEPEETPSIFERANGQPISASEIDELISTLMSKHEVPGLAFALINHGEVVYQSGYGLTRKSGPSSSIQAEATVFEAASISKALFAYFALQAVDQGLLSLDTPLASYLPHPQLTDDPRHEKITARMVLSHTSGLPNWRFHAEDGVLRFIEEPGQGFNYSGEAYEYLADVLAHLYDTDLEGLNDRFQIDVCAPLSIEACSFEVADIIDEKAYGHEAGETLEDRNIGFPIYFGAAYGFHTTVTGLAQFMLALLHQQGLSDRTYRAMLSEQVVLPEDETLRVEDGFESWGLGLIRTETPYGMQYAHGGMNPGFQGYFMVIPERDFGFAFLGNSDTAIDFLPQLEGFLIGESSSVSPDLN